MSATACAFDFGPPCGMLPPYQVRQEDPCCVSLGGVPMYACDLSHEYALLADAICEWQKMLQLPIVPEAKYVV